MLRQETDFIGDAIGVDPDGCGCTDCLVGNSFPSDDYRIEELIRAHLEDGRKVVNRTSGTIVMYKDANAGYKLDVVGAPEVKFIADTPSWNDESEYDYVIHPAYCVCYRCEEHESVPTSEDWRMNMIMREHYDEGKTVFNGTGNTLLIFRTWMEDFIVSELNLESTDSVVSVISYDY